MNTIVTAKNVIIPIVVLILLTLTACTQKEQPIAVEKPMDPLKDITHSFEHPDSGQEFKILHVYSLFKNYFSAIGKNPDKTNYQLYQQEVLHPVYESCLNGANVDYSPFDWVSKDIDVDALTQEIDAISTSYVNDEMEASLLASAELLPSTSETTICVFPKNEELPSDMFTTEPGNVLVFYKGPDKLIKAGIAHEYHHSVWLKEHVAKDKSWTLTDQLVIEGEAMMFERQVYPEMNHTFYIVDESYDKEQWNKVEPNLESIDGNFIMDVVFGNINGFSHGYGYSEGYKIIRAYLENHPTMSVEEWTAIEPTTILEDSNYIENYR